MEEEKKEPRVVPTLQDQVRRRLQQVEEGFPNEGYASYPDSHIFNRLPRMNRLVIGQASF